MTQYHNFDLLFTRTADGYRAHVTGAPGGETEGDFALPFDPDEVELLGDLAGTRRSTDSSGARPASDLTDLGRRLFENLFQTELASVLADSRARVGEEGLRLRVRFAEDAQELASLPWEILFDPVQRQFLGLGESTQIVRYLALPRPQPTLRVEPPLHILTLMAGPDGLEPVDTESDWVNLQSSLAPLLDAGTVTLERVEKPSLSALRRRLLGEKVHVLHFVGHGLYDADAGEGMLAFADEENQPEIVSASALGDLLSNHSDLRLVYLSACEGALSGQGNIFSGVAQTLVLRGIPAVVAMQEEIRGSAADALSRTFYTALAAGRPVDAALTQGRLELATDGSGEWAIPVLFSRSRDNLLFELVEQLPPPVLPYPGMRPFTSAQKNLFFGRDDEIAGAVDRLSRHPFLTVVGPSGSGKSSLVYAGIITALETSSRFGGGKWDVRIMRPGDRTTAAGRAAPMQALKETLKPTNDSTVLPHTQQHAEDPPQGEPEGGQGKLEKGPTLLFIDQFEETFTLSDENEAANFLRSLGEFIGTPNLYIILTVRADFYGELIASPLWQAIRSNQLVVEPLGEEQLWAAIVEPAAQVGVTVDEGLAVRIIADAAGEAGVLPLVQETLVMLWERVAPRWENEQSRRLLLADYQEMAEGGQSGIQVAIDRLANHVYHNELSETMQPLARRIFLRLIQFGEGRADTRRQQSVAELRAAGDDPGLLDETLSILTANRLLTSSGEEESSDRRVDISHEALITGWGLLRRWIGEKREAESTRRRLEEKVAEWERLERSGGLLDEYEVQEAEAWLQSDYSQDLGYSQGLVELVAGSKTALTEAEEEKAEAERTRQRSRLFAGGLVLAALVIALVGFFAWTAQVARGDAETEREAAETAQTEAVSARSTAEVAATAEATARIQAEEQAELALSREAEANTARATAVAAEAEAQTARRSADLAGLALTELDARTDPTGSLALLLAREAVLNSWQKENFVSSVALFSLNRAVQQVPSRDIIVPRSRDMTVASAIFSPDGSRVVTSYVERTARVWDVESGEELLLLQHTYSNPFGGPVGIAHAVYSPDGSRILTVDGYDAKVWDAESGAELLSLSHDSFLVASAVFSPDGNHIATVGWDATARIWDAESGAELLVLSHVGSHIFASVAYSPDGSRLVTASKANASDNGTANVWDVESGTELLTLSGHSSVNSAVYSPDGSRIVTAGDDGTVAVWNAESGDELFAFSGSTIGVLSAVYSPDGTNILTTLSRGDATVFDATNGKALLTLGGHTGSVFSAVYSPDGTHILTAESNGATVWDLENRKELLTLSGHGGVTSATYRSDGSQIVIARSDGTVAVLEAGNGKKSLILSGHGCALDPWTLAQICAVSSVAYSPDEDRILTAGGDGTVRVWNTETGEELLNLTGHSSVNSAVYSPEGSRIVTSGDDGTVKVWHAESGNEIFTLLEKTCDNSRACIVNSAVYSSDGKRIVTADANSTAIVWNAENGEELLVLTGHSAAVNSAVFSSDSSRIVTASDDGTARIWNAESGEELLTLIGHSRTVNSAVYSPDGGRIITASEDGTVKVWNGQNGEELFTLTGHSAPVTSAIYSPDGSRIVTTTVNGTVRVWYEVEPLLNLALSKVQREPPELTPEEKTLYGFDR